MAALDEFSAILTSNEPLGSLTCFGTGGSAEWVARPQTGEQLSQLVRRSHEAGIANRVLGGGSNILVRDEGVKGVVIVLNAPAFRSVTVSAGQATAGAGASLSDLISSACRARLSGLEDLVGIPGSVGGALRNNTGWRTADIGQHVHSVEILDETGSISTRMRADIRFGYHSSTLDDGILLRGTFQLSEDDPDNIVKRVKKIWIAKKASQPLAFQQAGYVFRSPRGHNAVELIENAGLVGTKVGAAEVCDRDPKFLIAHPGATSSDVLKLIETVRHKVEEYAGVVLDLQVEIW